jgi:GWxTD domain-containing protein
MRLIRQQTRLLASIFLSLVCFPLCCQSQDNGLVPRSTRSWLQVPAIKEEYKKWLREDVVYIITDQEHADFKNFSTDTQRDEFVVAFWDRRNPTPGASENKFKEEHYRRLAYANTHFAASIPGWKTDRGKFYIMYGPPDSVDSKTSFTPPSETWHYLFVEGIGRNVVLSFTDKCSCGEYQLSGTDSDSRAPVIFDPLRK